MLNPESQGDASEPMVRLRGRLFPYALKAPFTPSGKSILGGVEYDPEADHVRCHECGGWFESITGHVSQHGLSTTEYRRRHGLNAKASLVNERIRSAQSIVAKRVGLGRILGFTRGARARKTSKRPTLMLEYRNERGTCPEQTLKDLRELGSRLGHAPTETDMRAAGIHSRSAKAALHVVTHAELMQKVGMVAVGPGRKPVHTKAGLVQSLKKFFATHQRMPLTSEYGTQTLPFKGVYVKWFGSMVQAYEAAGLAKAATRDCVRGRHRDCVPSRSALLDQNLAWADGIARGIHRHLPPSFDVADLEQEARIALWRFIEEKYDPSRNSNVQAAAYRAVRGAVLMKCRRRAYLEATHESLSA